MATFSFLVHESKLGYAIIKKCNDLHTKAYDIKTVGLAQYFSDISSQWDDVAKILGMGVSSKIAWTGTSMTKADTVPDDTRIPPNVEINTSTIRIMKQKADDLGVTLSSSYDFFDEANGFVEAMETWQAAAKLFLDIVSLAQELTMYKYVLAELHGGIEKLERSPGQLIPYMNCDVPLAEGATFVENLNWDGIEAAFGDFYQDVMNDPVMETLKTTPLDLESQRSQVQASKLDDPDNPGVKTIYTFSVSGGYSLIGAVTAKDSDGVYWQTGITYTSSTAGKLTLDMAVGSAPATVDFDLHGLMAV